MSTFGRHLLTPEQLFVYVGPIVLDVEDIETLLTSLALYRSLER